MYHFIPIIWYDWDFDASSLTEYMQKKIELTAPVILKYGHHVNDNVGGAEMEFSIMMLARLGRRDYYNSIYERVASRSLGVSQNPQHKVELNTKAQELFNEDFRKTFEYIAEKHQTWWD